MRSIKNEIYETLGAHWWDEDASFELSSLRYCINPVRYAYIRRILNELPGAGRTVLDIGCGGGFLSESFADDGFAVTAIDPSPASIETARTHAASRGLNIDYRVGRGEALPFPKGAFDIVACCDVLEHVDDAERVVRETARVLKPGGVYFYDTINRTPASKLVMIKIWQDWGLVGKRGLNLHVWEKFITPDELVATMRRNGLAAGPMKGFGPVKNPLASLWTMQRIRRGKIRATGIAAALPFQETDDLELSYMGYALRGTPGSGRTDGRAGNG